MKKRTDAHLYRSFLVDFLYRKDVVIVSGRNTKSQKIKFLERQYTLLYGSNPKLDFIPLKSDYDNDEKSYNNIFKNSLKKDNPNKKKTSIFVDYKNINWLNIRKLVFERDSCECVSCKSETNLQCHHNYYISGRELWEYSLNCFSTLCKSCHSKFHETIKGSQLVIRDKNKIAEIIKEEESVGFYYEKKTKSKAKPKIKAKPKPKAKIKKVVEKNKPETIQQRRNRLIGPQWKIDEYNKIKGKDLVKK